MRKYAIVYEAPNGPEGNWGAYVPDLPGLGVAAESYQECRELIVAGISVHIAALQERGFPVPEPTTRVEEYDVAA